MSIPISGQAGPLAPSAPTQSASSPGQDAAWAAALDATLQEDPQNAPTPRATPPATLSDDISLALLQLGGAPPRTPSAANHSRANPPDIVNTGTTAGRPVYNDSIPHQFAPESTAATG
jgi:hypothetical protein